MTIACIHSSMTVPDLASLAATPPPVLLSISCLDSNNRSRHYGYLSMGTKEVTSILEIANARHGPEANLGEQWPAAGTHDHLATPLLAVAYFDYQGLPHPPGTPTDQELQAIRDLADAGRSVFDESAERSRARIERAVGNFSYRLTSEGKMVPVASGWRAFAADAALGLVELPGLHDRLRTCANPACDWLFLDESRNHSRQWCSMESCGSRAKMARYRSRRRDGAAEVPRGDGAA